ncbi:Ctk3p KNAG_0G03390 [Huiozyma naganishii CBS 8797]|uniref:CTD kinase subunit gamma Ctk3 C-terminal domain-containing protein n=1 Tax=Huiozyma naganishii (strain ATCC MYA-139 / BCRC 22969 / CBS 8797 / KCTC 17520 / NBRC 10181 / NCYC 3082 / Yp74L-3) TaxID=1071383 RepID=J7S1C5_HUIN7|nr:hypothetical protein KNAG_0G03390 [Kazachstania naganishii CBS 8797]CCK71397.1 hypothetical protein KNAG_0G03390 [Kazachstania naganishii CBS 8797]
MDSIEARLQFIQVLKNLHKTLHSVLSTSTAATSVTAGAAVSPQHKFETPDPIQFYLNNCKEHYEDFHLCMLDQMEKMDPLDRVTVVLYYGKIMGILNRDSAPIPQRIVSQFMLPSLATVFQLALPQGNTESLANLTVCLDMLNILREEFAGEQHSEVFRSVKEVVHQRMQFKTELQQRYLEEGTLALSADPQTPQPVSKETVATTLGRMELDRERHKRSKEQIWVVERPNHSILNAAEFEQKWASTEPLNEFDMAQIRHLTNLARESYLI